MSMGSARPISVATVWQARQRVYRYARITPLFQTRDLYLKLENLQPIGAFKIRGATNFILKNLENAGRGVITASSGNHGMAVAFVSLNEKIPCTVVIPENAPEVKINAIQSYGARIIRAGKTADERFSVATDLAKKEDLLFVPSYDHPDIMAGQGTLGIELLLQNPEIRVVYVPVSGGGLISGIALAIKCLDPSIRVIGVEPENIRRYARSRAAGHPVTVDSIHTIADGLRVQTPGQHTWPVIQTYVDDFIAVRDDEIIDAIRWCAREARQYVEPSGAAAVAGALKDARDKPAVAIVSGGNVDPTFYARYIVPTDPTAQI